MKTVSRRSFIRKSIVGAGGVLLGNSQLAASVYNEAFTPAPPPASRLHSARTITIRATDAQFEREPLLHPFGFKGGYLSELWQVVSRLESTNGHQAIGLGTQSVLWSDSQVFSSLPESGGNTFMYALTIKALQLLQNRSFCTPVELIDELFPELYTYGKKITGNAQLRPTFVLNALVSVDFALWLLYARENGITHFDDLIPEAYRSAFSHRHTQLAAIPLISYNVGADDLKREADAGYFFMKIKIGQSGTQSDMLQKDMNRLREIHSVFQQVETPYTGNGKLPYYFDANGRYENKETFLRFLDYADKIKAFDQIVLIEEPFPEHLEFSVDDIPVRLAADESAHTEHDAIRRIDMGYKAMALKPIAKTLSMTMKIAKAASDRGIPCFCADLTVNPAMVEWNKNVAARLAPFPGLHNVGLVESNGHQNYVHWDTLKKRYPANGESWIDVKKGFYSLDDSYYEKSGGIFEDIPYYSNLFTRK